MTKTSYSRLVWRTTPSLIVLLACLAIAAPSYGQNVNAPRAVVTGENVPSPTPNPDDPPPRLEHIMKEVSGTQITVTKKATVIKLDKQPPVENNNLQELFVKAPGLLVSEQQNPEIGRAHV